MNMRMSQQCYAKVQNLAAHYGWHTSAVIRALLDIAWMELNEGKSIDWP